MQKRAVAKNLNFNLSSKEPNQKIIISCRDTKMKNTVVIEKTSVKEGDLIKWKNRLGEEISYLVVKLVKKTDDREIWECLHEGKLVNIFLQSDFTK